jgi:hypothetical protein
MRICTVEPVYSRLFNILIVCCFVIDRKRCKAPVQKTSTSTNHLPRLLSVASSSRHAAITCCGLWLCSDGSDRLLLLTEPPPPCRWALQWATSLHLTIISIVDGILWVIRWIYWCGGFGCRKPNKDRTSLFKVGLPKFLLLLPVSSCSKSRHLQGGAGEFL